MSSPAAIAMPAPPRDELRDAIADVAVARREGRCRVEDPEALVHVVQRLALATPTAPARRFRPDRSGENA